MTSENSALMAEFIQQLTNKRYSERTTELYGFVILGFTRSLQGLSLTKAEHRDVSNYLVTLVDANSPITINLHLTIVNVFLEYLIQEGRRSGPNPCLKIKKKPVEALLPAFCVEEEIKRLYVLMEEDQTLKVRDVTMFDVFYGTGIRTSELCNLKIEDYFFDRCGFLKIRSGKGKKDREVALPDYTHKSLIKFMAGRHLVHTESNFIFINDSGKRFSRQHVYSVVHNILKKMYARKTGAHRLRHSFATHLLNQTGQLKAVQMQLGHASPATTEVYTHLAPDRIKTVYEKAHPKA